MCSAKPSSSPPASAATGPRTASRASPAATTPVKTASPEAPSQTAPGSSTRNGSTARAASAAPSARRVTGTETAAVAPTSTQQSAAAVPPPRPIRSSQTKTSSAPGGCPAVWVDQESGWKSRIRSVKPASIRGMSTTPGTSCRYSACGVSRRASPADQPSTRASDSVQATAASQPAASSAAQRAVRAQRRPGPSTTTATSTASGVPQPACGRQVA
ncbi:hypothetical protein B0E53_07017 [Micromonospora sp. MH33]|nr:hypothetical protein B0E53_07017 [Micromonospora sp. MH33]